MDGSAEAYDIPYEHSLKIIIAVSNGSAENVAFRLYNEIDKAYFTAVKDAEGVYEVSGNSLDGTLHVPDKNGEIIITGLPKASYILSEAATADGNFLLAEKV